MSEVRGLRSRGNVAAREAGEWVFEFRKSVSNPDCITNRCLWQKGFHRVEPQFVHLQKGLGKDPTPSEGCGEEGDEITQVCRWWFWLP